MLFTGGFSIYYFITLIIQCYIITPILIKCYNIGIILCTIISVLAIIVTTWFIQIEKLHFPLLLYVGPVYLWIVFFMLGIYLHKYENKDFISVGWALTIIGYLLQIIETAYYLKLNGTGLGIKLSSFIFSAGIIILLVSRRTEKYFQESKFTRLLTWIGEVSFGIYLCHMYVVAVLHTYYLNCPCLILWLITILITVIIKNIFPHKFVSHYLGL